MQIIIIGCGNVGGTLAERLSKEGHNIAVIDTNKDAIAAVTTTSDVLGIVGNGASLSVLLDAGMREADLLIAVTGSDELNLLCCLIAKKAGKCHTIVRVSNPLYSKEASFIKSELGLSLTVNPQLAAAREMARVLRFPSALKVDYFAKGRMELVVYRLEEDNPLCGMNLQQMSAKYGVKVLIPVVERNDEICIPGGDFVLQAGDEVSIIATSAAIIEFFTKLKIPTAAVKSALLIGSGLTGRYLIHELLEMRIKVKVIEKNQGVCDDLSEHFPKASILRGNGTDKDLLLEEGLCRAGAFVTLTDIDEENLMLALYAKSVSKAKLITKVHRVSYDQIIEKLNVGIVIYPKFIAAETIIKYVRAMQRSQGSDIETLYMLNDNRVEALEFLIEEGSPVIGIPIQELPLKPDVIIASITHKGKGIIPHGKSVIAKGDTIVIITKLTGFRDIRDALVTGGRR